MNYSDQVGSNEISVLLCEGPKPPNSIISGFVNPWDHLFMDFTIPNYLTKYKKFGNAKNMIFCKSHNLENQEV